MPTRAEIVAKAREFLDTPFQHQGRMKGKATDCVGVPLMVGEELGMKDTQGEPIRAMLYASYSGQPAGNFVHMTAAKHLRFKPISEMKPGDVITMRVPVDPCHVAIVGEIPGQGLSMIHAYAGHDRCVEMLIDQKWRERIVGCFEFPEVTD